jgi:CUG-BP- and ETR3-like factor
MHAFNHPLSCQVPENKLFIGMLSREATEDEVKELFATYGDIREIYMIRNADGSSRCSAFLRFVKRDAAVNAINSLHNNVVMEGAARPLIVKFADNKQQRNARNMHRSGSRDNDMMPMGPVGAPYQGFVHQGVPAQMAMHPHHPGHQYAMPPYPGPYGAGQPHGPQGHHMYAMYPPFGPPPYAFQNRQDLPGHNPRPREGPAGANLFVYHLPHDLTDADLATAFNPFGSVISAKVYVDKYTGESKGFGKKLYFFES